MSLFARVSESRKYSRQNLGIDPDPVVLRSLIEKCVLPTFFACGEEWILKKDLEMLVPVLAGTPLGREHSNFEGLFAMNLGVTLAPREDTLVDVPSNNTDVNPSFFSAIRNLLAVAPSFGGRSTNEPHNISYFPPARIITTSRDLVSYATQQVERSQVLDASNASQFANSAYYMGSKRALRGFVVEAISSVLPKHGAIVDLMCGSGAASGAFNKFWRTIASDAQEFCTLLALVQGGGFSANRADGLLKSLIPLIRAHVIDLRSKIAEFLDEEDRIFHGDLGPQLLERYRAFTESFPTLKDSGTGRSDWNPQQEVLYRKHHSKAKPYCLFTTYFANVYFGLRQCVEIDSVRFAIDQIELADERRWAIGALIATLSALGTTYAGHFAQPRFKRSEDLGLDKLSGVLEQRSCSVIHEFSVRLRNLAEESEKAPHPIELIPGPWPRALSTLDQMLENEQVVVYLDAPYKREEYSRYYHVLETLVHYSYPACMGSGRMPDKGTAERPRSEFFTRASQRIDEAFIKVISDILTRGWTCAWSYSDSGDASILSVVEHVSRKVPCHVNSFVTPYEHKPQGGQKPKKVKEYLIILTPS